MPRGDRIAFDFDGFEDVVWALKAVGENAKKATEEALAAAFNVVTSKAEAAMKKHIKPVGKYGTGETLDTLRRDPEYEWVGDTCSVKVGFNIKQGGLPSIFLMRGTPKIKKDQELYNAFYGAQTKKEYTKAEEDALMSIIASTWGK